VQAVLNGIHLKLQAVVNEPQVSIYACCLALLDIVYNHKIKDHCFNRFLFFFSGDSRRGGASFAHCITRAERVML
jgi:hypothetical protein